jgi:hypothetical protein
MPTTWLKPSLTGFRAANQDFCAVVAEIQILDSSATSERRKAPAKPTSSPIADTQ